MLTSSRRLLAALLSVLTFCFAASPAAVAAASEVELLGFDRMARGSAVQVTASITCEPVAADTTTYFSLTLWQGSYLRTNYIEGFGGLVDPTQQTVICDNTAHEYSFTVVPTQFFADQRFTPGPAMVEYQLIECTLVAPETFNCTGEGVVRESVKITP
jgi:hypothetical protein